MTNQEIQDICKKYNINNYSINPDGSIDVNGNVYLSEKKLKNIPLKFNRVSGNFYCYSNMLKTLEGSPNYIGGSFYCFENKLTSLEGSSNDMGGNFYCTRNPLESLNGYNGEYDKLYCSNKEKLIRKNKLKILNTL